MTRAEVESPNVVASQFSSNNCTEPDGLQFAE